MSDLTAAERVERARRAIAEVAPPVVADGVFLAEDGTARYSLMLVPPELIWRASIVTTPTDIVKCWPCWDRRSPLTEDPCGHSPISQPWPEVVR